MELASDEKSRFLALLEMTDFFGSPWVTAFFYKGLFRRVGRIFGCKKEVSFL